MNDGLEGYRKLQARIRETPLTERLKQARSMIGKMCSEHRAPKLSIPVQHYDEDIFITTTLEDALKAINGGGAEWSKLPDLDSTDS
ncbi:MAG: hypothetical protein QOH63_1968 [Acidobacteriota bacterium]|jgi:hypothetical protein|nr:hypothetical protein [Acidobacteriota bacterium]